ncbi:polysaccharide pyruvyl transferase CsaB [Alkaliphilus serpentinus]|uniref:Polysaccharide pyruvyl transferase CsaB n=1 Tax=Alkaliphilus serpentinus TaxID=1482731 RepID=A0A833HRM4_9FIRM|nr:polysaccharide pyruvyl transferase CsaB [Alkaliphilus serpentinus]KAB3533553.1 polysaccharide pyruvyl transferase CsaB [Alkaliphilus serpentinus]
MKKVFLFGYYGFRNAGDEAILKTIIKQIRRKDIQVSALTYNAKETTEKYNIVGISRNHYRQIIKAIKDSDAVICGGGSILQDVTSSRSLLYYLAIVLLAKKMGKKVMFYGNGFGPINSSLNRRLVKYIIEKVDVITVRDYNSKELLQSLGVKHNITVTADVTFGMDLISEEEINSLLHQEGFEEGKKYVGISVRRWKGQESYKKIIAATADYLDKRGYNIVFIPMQYPEDVEISTEIVNLMETKGKIITKSYSPEEIAGIISRTELMIGMRLHSLIFATIVHVPMVGLEYEEKIHSFLKSIDQRSGGKVEKLDQIHLYTVIEDVLNKRNSLVNHLKEINQQHRKKAERTKEIFMDLIKEDEGR